jgi:hypothetical protein
MDSMRIKTAYPLFFTSFVVWLSVLLSVCFPSGEWSNPIRFPNLFPYALFFVSAIVAAVSCFMIGFDYIGLNLQFKHRPRQVPLTSKPDTAIPQLRVANPASTQEPELRASAQEEETTDIFILQQPEEEQATNKQNHRKKRQRHKR